jgi:hypothetical protein
VVSTEVIHEASALLEDHRSIGIRLEQRMRAGKQPDAPPSLIEALAIGFDYKREKAVFAIELLTFAQIADTPKRVDSS